ncbi:MAG: hypothetical protein U0O28_07625 [Methanobrevibacter smithii]|uniref:hypothetical protein n=1 Tax=Methanobrevibacter TaxID=2172 RepID=UPI00037683B4|nr:MULTISPECIES: hypothetical protein [Methanobrevibacter]URN49421.1 hypothetical protein K4897_09090 [Methanobrevibacter sp. TLL-48-HuF1]
MAFAGITLFSHILPVIFGFFGVLLLISGTLDENKYKFSIGIVLFVLAAILPYIILRFLLL